MRKRRKFFHHLLVVLVLCIFLYSGYRVISYVRESRVSQNLTGALEKQAIIYNETKPAQTNSEISDPSSATEDTLQTRTEEPQEAAPFCMDFEVLQAYNQDIIAWIYCEDTPISYPVVQTDNNAVNPIRS